MLVGLEIVMVMAQQGQIVEFRRSPLGGLMDMVDLETEVDIAAGDHTGPVPEDSAVRRVELMVRPKWETALMSPALWNTTRSMESLARALAMGTGIGPMPSISQISPGRVWPLKRASISDRTTMVQVGGRVTMSMESSEGPPGAPPRPHVHSTGAGWPSWPFGDRGFGDVPLRRRGHRSAATSVPTRPGRHAVVSRAKNASALSARSRVGAAADPPADSASLRRFFRRHVAT